MAKTNVTNKNWYVIHTYSGYEDRVSENLKQRVHSMGFENKIFDVIVPKENQIEIKNGRRRIVERRIFPGYVLVQMDVTEDSWFVVRNTPNVTGFVGSGTTPTPISEDDMIDFSIGEAVNITDGPFKGFDGQVNDIDEQKGKIKVLVNMFGRETPVELDSLQVKKI
jgi:transcriptional antiterminator NusG